MFCACISNSVPWNSALPLPLLLQRVQPLFPTRAFLFSSLSSAFFNFFLFSLICGAFDIFSTIVVVLSLLQSTCVTDLYRLLATSQCFLQSPSR